MEFDVKTFDVDKFDAILARGLSSGLGDRAGRMCIEAAICAVLDLPHGDDPGCVARAVRAFKIKLNDGPWSTHAARAEGLRALGLAQLGSLGTIEDSDFSQALALQTVKVLIPHLFRAVFNTAACLAEADTCEAAVDLAAAHAAACAAAHAAACAAAGAASYAASYAAAGAACAASYAASYAAGAAAHAAERAAGAAAHAAERATYAADAGDIYLKMSGQIVLDVLKELNSPGCALL